MWGKAAIADDSSSSSSSSSTYVSSSKPLAAVALAAAVARIRLFAGQGGMELADDSRLWPIWQGGPATLALALRPEPPRSVKISWSDMIHLRRVLAETGTTTTTTVGSGATATATTTSPWPSLHALGLRPEDRPYYVEYGDYDGHWDFMFQYDLGGEYKDYRPRKKTGGYHSVISFARKNKLNAAVAALEGGATL